MAKKDSTYPDHCEEDTDGAKNGLDWCDTRDLLCEIEEFDGQIQRGESTIPPLLSLGLSIHGTIEVGAVARERCEMWAAEKNSNPNGDSRSCYLVIGRLAQTESFDEPGLHFPR